MIGLNILVFLVSTVPQWGTDLYQWGALSAYYVVVQGEFYRLLSSMFMHSGALHILMNMLSIYFLGLMVERLFRPMAYLSLYFITGLWGSFVFMYWNPIGSAVGASGAIFGIFGALAGFAWVHRKTMQAQFQSFMKDFGMVIVLNFVIGVIFDSIAMSAHIGGLIAGLIGGAMIAYNPKYLWVFVWGSLGALFVMYYAFPLEEFYV